jgi:hypothetical protein
MAGYEGRLGFGAASAASPRTLKANSFAVIAP